ncbi:MAG: FG-GAP repeat protein, partial [Planctomycetota bacterium]
MIQFTTWRFAFVTILALSGAFFSDTQKNAIGAKESAETAAAASKNAVPNGLAASDWSSIRAAYEAGRHKAFPIDGGFRFRNPGQQWSTQFDGRRFVTSPDGNAWSWGLELQSYGIGADQKTVGSKANVSTEGQSVSYNWDNTLTEWYKNDTRGLEHGFSVKNRPTSAVGLLTLTLGVKGELKPRVLPSGRDVAFVNKDGGTVLNYSNLTVFDARGKTLPAHFASSARELCISVDDSGAQYPITIDPVAQQAFVKASNTQTNDTFGWAVSASGNTVIVGAPYESSNATGVNGDQSNNSASRAGAVYVFVRNGSLWSQQAYLKASNSEAEDAFGSSVAISGDTIVVGAAILNASLAEDSSATGVNGNQTNNDALTSGAAYVFVRSGSTWSQQAYLKASNTEINDQFGVSVAVSGDTVVVGAISEGSNAIGVNGNQSNNDSTASGAAYVFVRSGTVWSQQAYLKASNTGAFDWFGHTVSVSGDTVAVGAVFESSNATGINGNANDNNSFSSGAAYVFVRSGLSWSHQAYVKASNTGVNDNFGHAVSISGNTLIVGARLEDSNAAGVNGDQSNNAAVNSGAAYVFVRSGAAWSQQAYLKASNAAQTNEFGFSVSVSGNAAIVGAWAQGNDVSGAAYSFVRSGTTWTQQAFLKASNPGTFDSFGHSIALSGDVAVVGSPGESSNATGVNGDQNNNLATVSGAAYIFDLDNNPGIAVFGTGTPGCAGTQTLSVNHAPMINSPNFIISCDNAPASSLGLGLITDSPD